MYVILGRGQSEKWNAEISTDAFHRWQLGDGERGF